MTDTDTVACSRPRVGALLITKMGKFVYILLLMLSNNRRDIEIYDRS